MLRLEKELEVASGAVSRWLAGERRPDARFRIAIRDLLKVPIESWDEPAEKLARTG